mgnify:CR=1 FL=1
MKAVKEEIRKQIQEAAKLLTEAGNLAGEPDGPGFYLGFGTGKSGGREPGKGGDFAEYKALFDTLEFKRLPAGKKAEKELVSESVQELVKNLRNQAKDLLKEIQDRYFSESLEEILEHLKKAGEPVAFWWI